MDHNYLVEYVPSHQTPEKANHPIDGSQAAKGLEALLVEYDNSVYQLIETQPITSIANKMVHMSVTKALIAIFKKIKN